LPRQTPREPTGGGRPKMTLLMLLVGFAGLVLGGELLVRGAVAIALRFGLSQLMIGLTLVGFGTSTPELVTSLQAAFKGSPGIAVGNVVGSNICNVLLILGAAALLRPIVTRPDAFRRDGTVLLGATLLCVGVVLVGTIGRLAGGVLLALLIGYVIMTWLAERGGNPSGADADVPLPAFRGIWGSVAFFIGGLLLTIFGARLLVDAAIEIAADLGVSEAVIGVTIVALGTSLPELMTSIIAAIKHQGDVAFGNIVGSNIFNIFGILGTTAIAQPLAVPLEIARLDIWVMLAAALLLIWVTITGWRITRGEGVLMLAGYGGYIGWLAATA
ncbi:MAG TPA: calcium/sodium antiporter, partial [Paracoccaceae bacterium]|nr:calcium/sodium antiporter [Paracoccaceae bacterium]